MYVAKIDDYENKEKLRGLKEERISIYSDPTKRARGYAKTNKIKDTKRSKN